MALRNHEGIQLQKGESYHSSGRYMFRWTDKSGKRRAIYADTIVDLRYMEHQLYLNREFESKIDPTTFTLNELYIMWREQKVGIQMTTMANYIYTYDSYIRHSFGKTRVISIRRSDIRQLYESILYDKSIKKTTLEGIHNVLHQVLQFGYDEGIIYSNPASGAFREYKRIRRLDDSEERVLTAMQERLFLKYVQDSKKYERWHPFFTVLIGTGMRASEITALRWKDIDFYNNEITVNHSLVFERENNHYIPKIHVTKTEASCRRIPMLKEVREAFEKERHYQIINGIKCNIEIEGYSDFVFISRVGKPRVSRVINKAIQHICTEYNNEVMSRGGLPNEILPHITCHTFRHSFATRLCESGTNIKLIQSLMGHSDIETTMNVYVAVTSQLKGQCMELVSDYFAREVF